MGVAFEVAVEADLEVEVEAKQWLGDTPVASTTRSGHITAQSTLMADIVAGFACTPTLRLREVVSDR
jgi:hypothetical protein